MLPVTYPQSHNYQQDDFHKTVARTLSQGSAPMSMDFHPLQQTLILGILTVLFFLIIFKFGLAPFLPSQCGVFTIGLLQLVPMLLTLDCGMLVPKKDLFLETSRSGTLGNVLCPSRFVRTICFSNSLYSPSLHVTHKFINRHHWLRIHLSQLIA